MDPDFRSSYSLDDLVGDVMSDSRASKAILDVSTQVEDIGFLLAVLQNERSLTLLQVLDMVGNPPGLAQAFETVLANLGK